MEPSDELRALMAEVVDIYMDADEVTWGQLWSTRPGVISLGTDPREWWEPGDVIIALHAKQARERGTGTISGVSIAAFQEGSVGWAVMSGQVEFIGGTQSFRLTAIAHLEHATWKLVHLHRSFGVLNEDLGVHLTTNLDRIAESVARERTDLAHAASPNGTVTILFTDLEGSTQLMERLGERAWMEMLRAHNRVVLHEVAAHSGFQVKSQGDGFMLAFASAKDALRCAVGIQRAFAARDDVLLVRIGVHTAEAIKEADDFYGKGVILAARIAAEARGAEILVSSLVHDLVESSEEFSFEHPVDVELKGLSGFYRAYAVRWQDA
jgi:class 3 adenylate cyclase